MTATVLHDGLLSAGDGVMLDVGDYETFAVQIFRVPFLNPANEGVYPLAVAWPNFFGSADGKQWSKIYLQNSYGGFDYSAHASRSDSGPSIFVARAALGAALQWFMVNVEFAGGGSPVHVYRVTVSGGRR